MTSERFDNAAGVAEVEALLARSQPRFFARLAELDWYAGCHRQWVDDLGLQSGGRILEVGCATGALTSYSDDRGYRVKGLDRSSAMIRRAKKTYPHLDFRVGDAMALPYNDNVFDAVVAASVINVVSDAEQVLSEMTRVCVPGGTVSALVPADDFTDADLDALVGTLGVSGFSQAVLAQWHRGPTKKSRSQLESLFGSVELESVVTSSYLGGMLIAATAIVG